jgi:hypothetical protein
LEPRSPATKFFPNANEVLAELQDLFSQAYHLDHEAKLLMVKNPAAQDRLRARIQKLEELCRRDALAAREYNRPEIVRYFYFSLETLDPEITYHLLQVTMDRNCM